MNKAVLIGRLTKEPDLRYTSTGLPVVVFSLAVDRNFKNANGEKETDFISCQAWRQTAELIAKYCHKGNRIACSGRIQTRSWTADDGQKRYVTEVVVEEVTFLESKNTIPEGQAPASMNHFTAIEDDEVPF